MVLNEATIILCSWLYDEHIGNLTMLDGHFHSNSCKTRIAEK